MPPKDVADEASEVAFRLAMFLAGRLIAHDAAELAAIRSEIEHLYAEADVLSMPWLMRVLLSLHEMTGE